MNETVKQYGLGASAVITIVVFLFLLFPSKADLQSCKAETLSIVDIKIDNSLTRIERLIDLKLKAECKGDCNVRQ